MKLAIVGATGMVGNVMLKVLEERNFPYDDLLLVASERSAGKILYCKGRPHACITVEQAIDQAPDIAIFSAGGATSKNYAKQFTAKGSLVIDNSSAWRMNTDVPLVVPEINMHHIQPDNKLIANPNCSTIQLVVALAQLHEKFRLKRLVLSTYQSVTGTGVAGVGQLFAEREGREGDKAYPHPIDLNCLPHGGDFDDQGYTSEETKLVNETRKILGDPEIRVTSTVVRVPVIGGHSISVNAEFHSLPELNEVIEILNKTPGVTLIDDPKANLYPMPIYSKDKDDVFVGRVRQDLSSKNTINLWVVADNLRKGAATNAIQIAEKLLK